jgi:hypothetical protein
VVELALSIAVLKENDPAVVAATARRPAPAGQTLRSPTLAQNIGLFGV